VEERDDAGEDGGGVDVVDAALVALVVALGGVGAHRREEGRGVDRGLAEAGDGEAALAPLGVAQHRRGEELPAVHVVALARQGLVPEVAGLGEGGVFERVEEVGAGEVGGEPAVAREDREFERLRVDEEAVAPELDDVGVVVEELGAVAQGARPLLAGGLEAALHLVGLHRVAERAELLDELAGAGHQRVAGEVGVQLLGAGEGLHAAGDALEDALGGGEEVGGAALALVEERLALRPEGVGELLPARGEVGGELVELAEAPLELLELDSEPGEGGVASLGRVGDGERALDGLREELRLRGVLGAALVGADLLRARLGDGAAAVELAEHLADRVEDPRPHGGVVDLQPRHRLREHGEALIHLVELRADGGEVDGAGHLLGVGDGRGDRVEQRLQRIVPGQELRRREARLAEARVDRGFEGLDAREVDRAQLAEGPERAPLPDSVGAGCPSAR
jgi:hypothetical protein